MSLLVDFRLFLHLGDLDLGGDEEEDRDDSDDGDWESEFDESVVVLFLFEDLPRLSTR